MAPVENDICCEMRLVDIGASKKFQNKPKSDDEPSPTLTRTRAGGQGFWLTCLERPLNVRETWLNNT